MSEADFAAAVERAAQAAELVDRTLERGRPRDPVRGADRRRVPRAGAPRGRGGGDRGRARRPLRRHQRDPVEGPGADPSGSSTRAGSGPTIADIAAREARRGARPRHAGPRPARIRTSRGLARARRRARRHARAARADRRRRCARRAASSARTSRWRWPRPRRSSGGRSTRGRDARRRRDAGARPPRAVAERPADAARRRPQPGRGWWRLRPRCPTCRRAARGSRSIACSTTRTPPACCATLLPHVRRVVFTRSANPRALLARHARVAGRAARRAAGRDRAGAARRAGARARAGRRGRRGARHRVDLPDRGPRARGRRRAAASTL